MGQLVTASCSYGYSETAAVGGMRGNHLSVCLFPFLCRDCNDIFSGDLYEYRNQCRVCSGSNVVSYADVSLRELSAGVVSVASCNVITMFALQPDYFPRKLSWLGRLRALFKPEPRALSESYEVNVMKEGYHCPECSEDRMCFELESMVD